MHIKFLKVISKDIVVIIRTVSLRRVTLRVELQLEVISQTIYQPSEFLSYIILIILLVI